MTNEKGHESDSNRGPTLVLMRHAARDFSDDGLSSDGERQASRLSEILTARGLSAPMLIESSPKRRTRATVRALAETTGQKIIVNANLDERSSGESASSFESRVRKFCDGVDRWAQALSETATPRTRLACSHLDWLEAVAQFLSSDENDLDRAEPWPAMSVRVYQFQDGIWRRQK